MYTETIQFTIHVKDKFGNNYNVMHINSNEMYEVQELLQYRSTWINMIGGYILYNYDVHVECKNHKIYVYAQLQIDTPIDTPHDDINMETIIENGKRNFNNYLSAENMLLGNGDTIRMNVV